LHQKLRTSASEDPLLPCPKNVHTGQPPWLSTSFIDSCLSFFSFAQSRIITSTEKALKKLEEKEESSNETFLSPKASQGPVQNHDQEIIYPSGRDGAGPVKFHKRRTRTIRKDTRIKATKNFGVETEQFVDAKEKPEPPVICLFAWQSTEMPIGYRSF